MSDDKAAAPYRASLRRIEDALIASGQDEMTWTTERGTFLWRTTEAARELAERPEPGSQPLREEVERAEAIVEAAHGDRAKLVEFIAHALVGRRATQR